MKNKQDYRKFYKEQRLLLYKEKKLDAISLAIVQNIKKSAFYKKAKNVLIFYPKPAEINLLSLLEDDKNFYLPRCNNKEIEVCPYKKGDTLKASPYGVYEPVCACLADISAIDIVFVPALCADKSGARIGYGGGYYDRFLSNNRLCAKKVIVLCKDFLCTKIPVNSYDVLCDIIITD